MIDDKLIFISVITRQKGHWGMFNAFQAAAGYAMGHGYKCMLSPHVGDSLCCRARQNTMGDFLESDAGWFFSMDDDVAIPPETFIRLIEADKPMIGGMYRLKNDKVTGPIMTGVAMRGKESFNFGQAEPAEVFHISGGCVMYKRSFIEEMIAHYPELHYLENITEKDRWALYQPYIHNKEYLSEDWAFCQRALNKGYKLYVHPQVLCDHWGLKCYSFNELLDKYRTEE